MEALNEIWKDNHVDIYSKYLLFKVIPCNLLLWGDKSWAVHKSLLNALEDFLHKSIRRMLRISTSNVIDEDINNE